jgi:hypothetical protein
MLNTKKFGAASLIAALMAGTCWAQAEKNKDEQQKFYRLDFVVKEVGDGKVINSRSYSTAISTRSTPAQIRSGSKVPRQTGSPTNPYEYIDVGVNIDCSNAREVENQLALMVGAEIGNMAPGQTAGSGPLHHSYARTDGVLT